MSHHVSRRLLAALVGAAPVAPFAIGSQRLDPVRLRSMPGNMCVLPSRLPLER